MQVRVGIRALLFGFLTLPLLSCSPSRKISLPKNNVIEPDRRPEDASLLLLTANPATDTYTIDSETGEVSISKDLADRNGIGEPDPEAKPSENPPGNNAHIIVPGVLLGVASIPGGVVLIFYLDSPLRKNLLTTVVIPASTLDPEIEKAFKNNLPEIRRNIEKFRSEHASTHTVRETKVGKIPTLEILPKNQPEPKVVLWCSGRGGYYQGFFLDAHPEETKALKVMLGESNAFIGGNYLPNARNMREIVEAEKSVFKRALEVAGGRYENLTVWGYSMGGGVGTQALSELASENPEWKKAKLIIDRSFARLGNWGHRINGKWLQLPNGFLDWFFHGDWTLNPAVAAKNLNPDNILTIDVASDQFIRPDNTMGTSAIGTNILIDDPKIHHTNGILGKKLEFKYRAKTPPPAGSLKNTVDDLDTLIREFIKRR